MSVPERRPRGLVVADVPAEPLAPAWRARTSRARRVAHRGFVRLVTAVVLSLAVIGAWSLGERLARRWTQPAPVVQHRPTARAPVASSPVPSEVPTLLPPKVGGTGLQSPVDAPSIPPSEVQPPVTPGRTSADESGIPIVEGGRLLMPVLGAEPGDLRDDFHDARGTGEHGAIDILAPRHTPIVAVDDGTIAKLFLSDRGGITLYQFDPTENYVYYYAHLEGYAPRIVEGAWIARGQVIGYVGTSGNAPPDTPHLHFSVSRLGAEKRWWDAKAVNPFPLLREAELPTALGSTR